MRRLSAGLAAALLLAGAARAQTINYGALEALFGEPVTASATGKPQRVSEVPVDMTIITAEQIRRSGAHDIPTVLARYTSLDVQQYAATSFSVGARGLTTPMNQRLLVLVDGRQVYLDDYGRTDWYNLPVQLAEIRQIEVVRGPNSALYGFNAVAGVINIVTYSPAYDRVNSVVVRGGTHGYGEASGVVTAPLGPGSGIRLSAGLRRETDWLRGHTPLEGFYGIEQQPARGQFAANALFRLAEGVQLGFDASYARSRADDLTVAAIFGTFDQQTWSLRSRLIADTRFGLIEAAIYHNALSTETLGGVRVTQGVTVAQLSDTVKLGAAHTLRASVEFRHNALQNEGGPTLHYNIVSTGLMWNWAIARGLESTVALRWDQLSLHGHGYETPPSAFANAAYDRGIGVLAYNAGLVWRPSELDSLRLSAARGIGLPSLTDLGLHAVSNGVLVSGNPRLAPTVVDNYELGWRRRIPAMEGHVGVTGFYQVNRGLGSSLGVAPGLLAGLPVPAIVPVNLGPARSYGVELSAAGRLPFGFDWGAEYRLAVVEGDLAPAVINYLDASPRHLLSARLGWGGGPYRADLFLRYATTMSGYRDMGQRYAAVTVDDYISAGARLAWRLDEKLTLAVEGSDLLHERQRQSIGLPARRQLYLSLRVDF